ncbi:beta-glucan synthesis-associated protein [Kalmusia sp. IMI 367209]|nr:beta-glucan synthesis-associated protein [Kalmusia sp. IMI 367209]
MQEPESNLPIQAGQSSSSLRAERTAATLEEVEFHTQKRSPISGDDQQRTSDDKDICSVPEKQNSHTPTRPLLNTSQSSKKPLLNRSVAAGIRRVNREQNAPVKSGENSTWLPPTLQSFVEPPIRPRPQSRVQLRSPLGHTSQTNLDVQPPGSTLTVHDLGADYTRYYDPFADGVRNSSAGSTPRPSSHVSICYTPAPATAFGLADPFLTPSASTTKLAESANAEENAEEITQKRIFLIDDRLSAPYEEKDGLVWPLWGDEAEDDDAMHLPHPDDDVVFKLKWKELFARDNIKPAMGVFLMLIGLSTIFVILPILSYTGVIDYTAGYNTPLDELPSAYPRKEDWAWVNDKDYQLLEKLRSGLIDPDTPKHAMEKTGEFGDEYALVFSDEFNDNNRTFYEGDDPYFFAPDLWYGATQDLEWYDPDAVTTWDGVLELRLDKFKNHGLEFRSGMLNSWNKLCFKGGIFEVSMSLPGPAGVHGLWPGAWTLGNLGRPGYMATTDGTWPYTYQACDVGITPNQSSYDGISWLPGQKLPSCTCPGEDHPTPGTGRGAPEIDIAEMSVSYNEEKLPVATQSYQVAPFDIWYYPNYEFTSFPDHQLSYTNTYTGGPFQQAISATTNLNLDWYDGKAYQRFSFEYVPGDEEGSHITWKIGSQTMFTLDGRAIGPNGNIQARQISQEPMSLILNLGISNSWTWINWERLVFPTVLRVDYIRWYQKKGEEMVTCDPPGFETTAYIKEHIKAYTNPNYTNWDKTGYPWPKHKLNSEC